ncbi:MAG: YdcF family protein [Hyphomicrobiaceae bacterium]
MFVLTRSLWFLVQPSMLLCLALLAGLALLSTSWVALGRRLAISAALLLLVLGISPIGNWLILPLEMRFPRPDPATPAPPAGIIVLGGGVDTYVARARGVPAMTEAGERVVEAAMLARRFPDVPVIYSGGSAAFIYDSMSEAEAARDILVGLGVEPKRILYDNTSRTTGENAKETVKLIASVPAAPGKRYLLVTSAYHMPRSVGVFRKAGLDVVAWPVDYRSRGPQDLWRFFDKPSEGLRRVDIIVREWLGLFTYWLGGSTSELYPGP